MPEASDIDRTLEGSSSSVQSQAYPSAGTYADARGQLLRSLQLWSTARKLYPKHSIRQVNRISKEFASLSDEEYSFYKMSCSVCHQHEAHHYFGRGVLSRNLREDCSFCSILRKCCEHFSSDGGDLLIRVACGRFRRDVQICIRGYMPTEDPSDEVPVEGRPIKINTYHSKCEELHVQLFSKGPQHERSPFSAYNDISPDPISSTSLDVMKGWINDCEKNHKSCRPPVSPFVPLRLIQLIDDGEEGARLYSPTTPVQYAALSYRWGSGEQSKTLKNNISMREKKLDTAVLPKTLHDALAITRGLGLQYIWIDAVCIAQDDNDEWAKEASAMADVYSTAQVVLSATSTEDCTHGFLRQRTEPIVIEIQQDDGPFLEYYARRNNSHTCQLFIEKADYTLFKRGWCMQERFLARRIIHFLPDEHRYQCQEERSKCECGAASGETRMMMDVEGVKSLRELRNTLNMDASRFACLWLSILWDYSKMNLSRPRDTLPALSGVAACLEHLKPGKYIAGLWEHGIAFQLGWRHVPPHIRGNETSSSEPVLTKFAGPTFSWSSYTRPLLASVPDIRLVLCTLEHSEVRLATTNPYGEVLDASIRLNGRFVPGDVMIEHLRTTKSESAKRLVQFDTGLYLREDEFPYQAELANFDETLENAADWKSMLCFGLYEFGHEDKPKNRRRLDALLLQLKEVGRPEYVRIGVAQNLEPRWFIEHAIKGTVTIV